MGRQSAVSGGQPLTRRDFLRLRRTETGKQLDLSCRALYMRCADAAIVPQQVSEWEPWMGEPPAVIERRSLDDILATFEQELSGVQTLCLLDAEWLDNLVEAERVRRVIADFAARGGRVDVKNAG